MKTVYKVNQMPSYIDENRIDWDCEDYNITVTMTEGKSKLSGEFIEWNEEQDDWNGIPLTKNECLNIAAQYELIIPTPLGMKKVTDIFKRD